MAMGTSNCRCVGDSIDTWCPVQGSQIIAAVCFSSQIGCRTRSWQKKQNLSHIYSTIAHKLTQLIKEGQFKGKINNISGRLCQQDYAKVLL